MTQAQPAVAATARALYAIGTFGTFIAIAILGASVLLRLTTQIGADGLPRSVLPGDVETAIRLVHRLTAACMGLLALIALVLCWFARQTAPAALKPVAWMVATTVVLAVIGPLTPGYRYVAVTVANVVAGTVLTAACWGLRQRLMATSVPVGVAHVLLPFTLGVFVIHIALGAAASALQMRGSHWMVFLHSGSGMLTTLLLGAMLWDRRRLGSMVKLVTIMAGLLGVQVVLGLVSLLVEGRPVALGFTHAMVSVLLAMGLVQFSVREHATV